MSSHHNHEHSLHRFQLVFVINLLFTIIEIVGAVMTNSVAILSDAWHDFGDTLSIGLAWRLEKVSQRKRDRQFSFGYRRFSLLGAVINCLVLSIGSCWILYEAITRLVHPEPVHATGMFGLAILGIAVNGFAAWRLSHTTSHSESVLSLHLIEDVLGWVAVLVVSIAIKIGHWTFLDPILSIAISVFILFNAFKRVKKTMMIFLQSIPDDVDMNKIDALIRENALVSDVHDTHVWSLDGTQHVLSTHLVVAANTAYCDILLAKNNIRHQLTLAGIEHATLEVEEFGDACELKECQSSPFLYSKHQESNQGHSNHNN